MLQYTLCANLFICMCVYCLRLLETLLGMLKICETLLTRIKEKNLMVSGMKWSAIMALMCFNNGYEVITGDILM